MPPAGLRRGCKQRPEAHGRSGSAGLATHPPGMAVFQTPDTTWRRWRRHTGCHAGQAPRPGAGDPCRRCCRRCRQYRGAIRTLPSGQASAGSSHPQEPLSHTWRGRKWTNRSRGSAASTKECANPASDPDRSLRSPRSGSSRWSGRSVALNAFRHPGSAELRRTFFPPHTSSAHPLTVADRGMLHGERRVALPRPCDGGHHLRSKPGHLHLYWWNTPLRNAPRAAGNQITDCLI